MAVLKKLDLMVKSFPMKILKNVLLGLTAVLLMITSGVGIYYNNLSISVLNYEIQYFLPPAITGVFLLFAKNHIAWLVGAGLSISCTIMVFGYGATYLNNESNVTAIFAFLSGIALTSYFIAFFIDFWSYAKKK